MTAAKDFVHLHLHSEFSLLDGANRILPLCERVREMGMGAVALTDHGNMFGALAFQKAAKSAGIRPILGCEIYVSPTTRDDRRPGIQRRTNHLLLLARDQAGYRNLCKLSTMGYREGFYYKPRVDYEALAQHSEGLIALSACIKGAVPQALVQERDPLAEELAAKHRDIYGAENYFLELQDHGLPEQHTANRGLVELSKRLGVGLVASNDSHYLCREHAAHQDAAICIQTGKTLDDPNRLKFYNDQFYVKDPQEMWALFGEIPEALLNTRRIAEMCEATIPTGEYHLPTFDCPAGMSQEEHLRELVMLGLRERHGEISETFRARADYELGVIHEMGFDGYFLVVWDFIRHARERGIPVGPGRGSAAGSIVAYALRITDLDPIEHGLIFERFLNPGRRTMPDIDIDFCFERRGEVIEYVKQRYGKDNVAQIITFGTLKAKAAIRDVGRILGVPLPEVDRLAKLVPDGPNVTLAKALREVPELKAAASETEESRRLMELAQGLEGTIRHASTHAAGVVIADRDLTDYIPLYQAPGTQDVATQFTMTEVEEIGLLKMDFLGLKNLTIIDKCLRLLRRTRDLEIDWGAIGPNDPKTYELLCRGDTQGVFQLESSGMRNLLQQVKPSNFSDITAMLALYRPGPLESGMATAFARRKHGQEKIRYDHPLLEPILRETYGVILYQEQVMQIARDLAGFSLAAADSLRKAMGKKIKEVMNEQESKFIDGAVANGVKKSVASKIWVNIVTFAGYGFNKSHSAAYAVITYRTAYLKANYPVEYMAAQLTNEISGSNATEKIAFYMDVCRPMGITIRPPDVNTSHTEFTVEDGDIIFGLEAIKNVGHGAALAIIDARESEGPFTSLQSLCERVDLHCVNAKALECLIKSGACDRLGNPPLGRSQMMAMMPELLDLCGTLARDRASGQESLFEAMEMEELRPTQIQAPDVPEWPEQERLAHERELLGHYLTGHPLDRHRKMLDGIDLTPTTEIPRLENNAKIDLLGLVKALRPITTRRGDRMAFLTVEDYHGVTEALVFSDAYEKFRDLLIIDSALWLRGQIQARNGDRRLRVDEVLSPEKAAEKAERWCTISLPCLATVTPEIDAALGRFLETLRGCPGDRRVRLRVATPDGVVDLATPLRVTEDESLRSRAEELRREIATLGV